MQPTYKLSVTCAPEELMNRLGSAVCNLYGIIAGGLTPNGTPTDMSPINAHLEAMGMKVEPHTPLVDITPGGRA